MNNLNIMFITSAILVSTILGISQLSFNKGVFTCDSYVLNTYLYVNLCIMFMALVVQLLTYYKYSIFENLAAKNGFLFFFSFAILSIGSIIGIHLTNAKNVATKHLFWLIFILSTSITFQPLHRLLMSSGNGGVIVSALLNTLILVCVLTLIAFKRPDFISVSWGPVLFFALLGVVLVEITAMLTNSYNSKFHRIINYIVIMIFIGYLLYDTKMLQIRSKKCLETCEYKPGFRWDGSEPCVQPDYIKESVNIFLDIYNLFIRILGLGSRRN
jgi:FtsH-binding integral membrane protein